MTQTYVIRTIRDLDELLRREFATGPKTVEQIAQHATGCSAYDVAAAIRIWVRMGWAKDTGNGVYAEVADV